MKPKNLFLLSIAAGLLAVILVQVQLRAEKGKTVRVFRATASAAPGETLEGRYLPITLPGENLFPNLLEEAPTAELEELVAQTPLREPIAAGDIVLFRHFDGTVDPGVRAAIPDGKRAMSIEVDEARAVSYLIQPGDQVDVLATVMDTALPRPGARAERLPNVPGLDGGATTSELGLMLRDFKAPGVETRPVLLGVEVLAVGERYRRGDAPRGKDRSYRAVTLLVDLEQAQKLAYLRDVMDAPMTLLLHGSGEAQARAAADPPRRDGT